MPVWLIALIIAALGGGALIVSGSFGGSGDSKSDFWTPDRCNETLQADVADLEEYQSLFKKARDDMEAGARRGDTTFAENAKKSMTQLKSNTAYALNVIDTETIPQCGRNVFREDLLQKVENARIFLNDGTVSVAKEEGMPDLRVTEIKSTFIPYETDEKGFCSGPYLDLVVTVTNYGADFPRPVDLENYTQRAQQPAEKLPFFVVQGELDFGEGMRKSLDFEIGGANGGMLKSGGTLKIPTKIRVEHNQTRAHAKANLTGNQLLKTGNSPSPTYETDFDIPIWDIYAESHAVLDGIDPDTKQYYISGKAVVSNKGPTPTPGPIEGSFTINEIDPKRRITGWVGKTSGPVSGSAEIYARTDSQLKLPTDISVQSSVHLRCPNGEVGSLSDGNTKNNIRELQQR